MDRSARLSVRRLRTLEPAVRGFGLEARSSELAGQSLRGSLGRVLALSRRVAARASSLEPRASSLKLGQDSSYCSSSLGCSGFDLIPDQSEALILSRRHSTAG